MNKFELALFVLSSYYHDIGMYVSKEEYKQINIKIKSLPEYQNLKESLINNEKLVSQDNINFFLTLDYIRANHGVRTNELITKMFPKTNESSYCSKEYYLWEHVKKICLSHTLNSEQLLYPPYNPKISIGNNNIINLTYLSTLLRLADICHFSKDRALPYFRKTKEFHSKKSESIWKYYGDIADTRPDSDSNTINIDATCSNFYNHRSIIMHSRNIQKELMNCHKILVDSKSKYSFPWKYINTNNVVSDLNSEYQYFESHFKLNYSKITSLLMGDRLYRNKLFAIRETLQNAIDSTCVLNKKIPSSNNYIYIEYYQYRKRGQANYAWQARCINVLEVGAGRGENQLISGRCKMPRIARLIVKEEEAVYHVMSRTALDGYVMGDVEKDFLLHLIKRLSRVYFAEVLGFCLMGNHFHLLVRMRLGSEFSKAEIKHRFRLYYGNDDKRELEEEGIPALQEKWGSLSEFVKEIKQGFSRYYNRRHHRKGFFWSERFKSVIVDKGETLINCLAYIDLNPIRAGIVEKPEAYRWCSLGYHAQTHNRDKFLSMDFGLREFALKSATARLAYYRRFVYEKGGLIKEMEDRSKVLELNNVDRFRYRTRYFTDSGIIGTKAFVSRFYQAFKGHFSSKHEKRPRLIQGLNGVYSLKRLSESI